MFPNTNNLVVGGVLTRITRAAAKGRVASAARLTCVSWRHCLPMTDIDQAKVVSGRGEPCSRAKFQYMIQYTHMTTPCCQKEAIITETATSSLGSVDCLDRGRRGPDECLRRNLQMIPATPKPNRPKGDSGGYQGCLGTPLPLPYRASYNC
jgi:hypothetical protein